MANANNSGYDRAFTKRAVTVAAIALAAALFAYFFWEVGRSLLLLFVAILLAVILDAVAGFLGRHSHLGRKPALALTVLLLVAAIGIGVRSGGVGLFEQMPTLSAQLDRSVNEVNHTLSRIGWIRTAVGSSKPANDAINAGQRAVGDISDVFTLTLSALADFFVVVVIGVYLAWAPQTYSNAFLHLFPIKRRARIDEVLCACGQALRRWVLGQLAAMAMVSVFITGGLLALGVNTALMLGVIAGVLTFVPYLGGLLAAVPAIMIGFLQSPLQALYVAALFLVSYTLEGYFFTPLIQQRVMSIAPAFLLLAQFLAGHFAGLPGVFVAAPLAIALTVIAQMLYVDGVLGDTPHVLGAVEEVPPDDAAEPDPKALLPP